MCEIFEMHSNRSAGYWTPAATGHNQACERLIGDLKRSNDIDELVTLHEYRVEMRDERSCRGQGQHMM